MAMPPAPQAPPPPTGPAPEQPATEARAGEAEIAAAAEANQNLSEDEKLEKAKGLFLEANTAFDAGDYATATTKYEEAYYLLPGKHGFAYKVGLSAWNMGDCVKADEYFRHFVTYETDTERKGEQIAEAKRILGEIAVSGCAKKAEPDPAPVVAAPAATGPVTGDGPELVSARDQRDADAEETDKVADKNSVSGLLIGGIVLSVVGVGGIGMGIGTGVKAQSNANELADLSSNATNTGFPTGDFSESSTFNLDSEIDTMNTLSIVGWTVGSVCLAAGISLIVVDVVKKKNAGKNAKKKTGGPEVTGLGPAIFQGGGGAAATMKF